MAAAPAGGCDDGASTADDAQEDRVAEGPDDFSADPDLETEMPGDPAPEMEPDPAAEDFPDTPDAGEEDMAEEDLAHLDVDDDEDGYTENQGDCDDDNPDVNPGAREICGDGEDQNCDGADLPCYGEPENVGTITDPRIGECSGLGWSRTQPILWLHNDSGDSARFFGVSDDGTVRAVVELAGARRYDWEDMGIGPHPDGGYALFLGGIGDNEADDEHIRIYRVAEPAIDIGEVPRELIIPEDGYDYFTLRYPDRPHNCETMFVCPDTGDIYIITKEGDGNSGIFHAPSPEAGSETIMTLVGSLQFGEGDLPGSTAATGGDITQDGSMIIIRTYSHIFIFLRFPGAPIADAFASHVYQQPSPSEPQGEAVAFTLDGLSFYTISEHESQPVYRMSAVIE